MIPFTIDSNPIGPFSFAAHIQLSQVPFPRPKVHVELQTASPIIFAHDGDQDLIWNAPRGPVSATMVIRNRSLKSYNSGPNNQVTVAVEFQTPLIANGPSDFLFMIQPQLN